MYTSNMDFSEPFLWEMISILKCPKWNGLITFAWFYFIMCVKISFWRLYFTKHAILLMFEAVSFFHWKKLIKIQIRFDHATINFYSVDKFQISFRIQLIARQNVYFHITLGSFGKVIEFNSIMCVIHCV